MAKRSTKHRVRYTIKGEVVTDNLVETLNDLEAKAACLPGEAELASPDCRPISDAKAARHPARHGAVAGQPVARS